MSACLAEPIVVAEGQQPSAGQLAQAPAPPASGSKAPGPSASGSKAPEPFLSLQRIRSRLEQPAPLFPAGVARDGGPTYRVSVFAPRVLMVPFGESLDPGWQAVAPGGLYHKELMDLMTPPEARPFAGFGNAQLVSALATSYASAFALWGAKKAVRASIQYARKKRVERIRREVEQELEAVKAAAAQKPQPIADPR